MKYRPHNGKRYMIWKFLKDHPKWKPKAVAAALGVTPREVSSVRNDWFSQREKKLKQKLAAKWKDEYLDLALDLAKQDMAYTDICKVLRDRFGFITNDTSVSYALRMRRNFRRDRSTISRLHQDRLRQIRAEQESDKKSNPYIGSKSVAMRDLEAAMKREMANARN